MMDRKNIVGFDPSLTSFGVCLTGPDFADTYTLAPKLKGVERLAWFRSRLPRIISPLNDVKLCVMEGYSFGSRGNIVQLGELGAVVRLAIYDAGLPLLVVAPNSLKKFVCGTGTAKKDEMRLAAYKRWGVEAKTSDEVDAFGLAMMGVAFAGAENKYAGSFTEAQRTQAKGLCLEFA